VRLLPRLADEEELDRTHSGELPRPEVGRPHELPLAGMVAIVGAALLTRVVYLFLSLIHI